MIQEVIVTTLNRQGVPHIAPMGIHTHEDKFVIRPFKPCSTLDNIIETRTAIINYCDDVRIFAGCLTGRRNWPLKEAKKTTGHYLECTLAHCELSIEKIEDDDIRPMIFCKSIYEAIHKPFKGFNRAQFAVIEAAILVSRLHLLPWKKIEEELAYLRIGMEKTAGEREKEAWQWLMEVVEDFKQGVIQA